MRREPEHEISCRVRADVAQTVQLVGRLEDNPTRRDNIRFIALQGFEGAFLDDHEFLGRVAMWRMGRFARVQRRDMTFKVRKRRGGRIKNGATLADLSGMNLEVGPVKDAGMHDRLAIGFGERDAGHRERNGNSRH